MVPLQQVYTAYAKEYEKSIYIPIKSATDLNKVLGIAIHELGESDYLARKLPIVVDARDTDTLYGRIIELFSHPHYRRISKEFGLEDLEGAIRQGELDRWIIKHNHPNTYEYGYEKIISVPHYLCTIPELSVRKEELQLYNEYSDLIEQVVSIAINTNTMGEPLEVEESLEQVLTLLKSIENKEYR
jgi:hypothetical protein